MKRKNNTSYDFIKRINEEYELIQVIATNDDYINWLEHFTNKYNKFCTESWLYSDEKLSKEDDKLVDQLPEFYDAINCYMKMNYLKGEDNAYADCVLIKRNGIGYEIGYVSGQGTYHYVNRIDPTDKCIDFELIKQNQPSEQSKKIETELLTLEKYLLEMIKSGIPTSAISQKVDSVLSKKQK
jgi:hypothetical protein